MHTLRKLLPHKSPEITQRHTRLLDDGLRKVSNLAGALIGGMMDERSMQSELQGGNDVSN